MTLPSGGMAGAVLIATGLADFFLGAAFFAGFLAAFLTGLREAGRAVFFFFAMPDFLPSRSRVNNSVMELRGLSQEG